jgi:hypothetical protein
MNNRTADTTSHKARVTEVRPGVWRVETLTASIVGQLVDELTVSVATQQLAQRIADEINGSGGQCAAEIRYNVADMLQYEYANEVKRRYRNQAYLNDLERALGIFTPSDAEFMEAAAALYDTAHQQRDMAEIAAGSAYDRQWQAQLRTLDEIRNGRKAA